MSDDIIDRDTHDHDMTYENEQSTVTIPLKEYDKLKDRAKYITDRDMIACIDKIEELEGEFEVYHILNAKNATMMFGNNTLLHVGLN